MRSNQPSSVAKDSCRRQWFPSCKATLLGGHHCPPRGLLRGAQTVAGAANRMQQWLIETLVDLLAQSADVNIDDIGLGIEVIVPHVFEQHRAGHYMAGVAHQVF